MIRVLASAVLLGLVGCAGEAAVDGVLLTVENQSERTLAQFDYAPCNSDAWRTVLFDGGALAPGERATSAPVPPGCYDLYVEAEDGCWREHRTQGNLQDGIEATWVVRALACE